MSDEIKKQEEVVSAAFRESERTAEAAEAKMNEWVVLRDAEIAAFDAWVVEHRLLGKMKEANHEQRR